MLEKKLLKVTLSRVDQAVFEGEVVSVLVPGIDGEMTLLANHKPLISPLKAGTITITKSDGTTEVHAVSSGTLEVAHNHATILV